MMNDPLFLSLKDLLNPMQKDNFSLNFICFNSVPTVCWNLQHIQYKKDVNLKYNTQTVLEKKYHTEKQILCCIAMKLNKCWICVRSECDLAIII